VPLRGDNIDTDRIIPARYLRSVSFDGLEAHLFADEPRPHPLYDARYAGATVLVVNANFGCGSSREHAPQAIRRRGFRAVLGESFSEIFFGNSVALGMPCVAAQPGDVQRIMRAVEDDPSLEVEIAIDRQVATFGGDTAPLSISPGARDAFLDGSWDATGLLLEKFADVEAVANRLPYTGGFTRP
jgi:3-isopropylmalate/(R)-2-methylmalate dehydratase small subunit